MRKKRVLSIIHRENISDALKGRMPKFIPNNKGRSSWHKGKKLLQEHKDLRGKANSISLKGKHLSDEHKKNIGLGNKGKIIPDKTRVLLSIAQTGKKYSDKSKAKMSLSAGGTGIPGGTSDYGIEFTRELRDKIRARDNYVCQNKDCGISDIEHQIKYNRCLCVHHIDYYKRNCDEVNLITLCHKCNVRANRNKKYWEEYYTQVMISKIKIINRIRSDIKEN